MKKRGVRKIITTIILLALIACWIMLGIASVMIFREPTASSDEGAVTPTFIPKPVPPKPASPDEILQLVNDNRGGVGAPALQPDDRLNQSALFKAEDMRDRNYYSHNDPATGQVNGLARMRELTGLSCDTISENLNIGGDKFSTSQSMVDRWLTSDAHRTTMLDPKFTTTGIAVVTAQDGRTLVVQHFCEGRAIH